MLAFLKADSYQWIVVDNGSELDLSAQLPQAVYLRMRENLGFGRANNWGAEKATTPYLFFVNPDCEFVGDCVTPLLESLRYSAVTAPLVFNTDGSVQLSFGPFLSILNEAVQRLRTRFEKSNWVQSWIRRQASKVFYPDYVSGCAFLIRADVFRGLGGFDENFFLYQEDVDLCKRVKDRKLQVSLVPDAHIMHARNRSMMNEREKVEVEYRKSQIYYYRKHNSMLQNLLLRLYLTIKFILK